MNTNTPSPFLAIDVVLLPKSPLMDELIALNKQLDVQQQIPLNATNCLPHVSLAMGTVSASELPNIANQFAALSQQISPINMIIESIYNMPLPDGRKSVGVNLQQHSALMQLHRDSMNIVKPYLRKTTDESLDPIRGVDQLTLNYIDSFQQQASFEHYNPHITVGFGELSSLANLTLNSTTEHLFICQLANYCTCGRILKSFSFRE